MRLIDNKEYRYITDKRAYLRVYDMVSNDVWRYGREVLNNQHIWVRIRVNSDELLENINHEINR